MAESDHAAHAETALAYLRDQLGDRAPTELTLESTFAEKPLVGDGVACVYSFDLATGSDATACATRAAGDHSRARDRSASARHYVVAGQTESNYFPSYGLDPDDAYSLHIGTRFMLKMRIGRVADEPEPVAARDAMHRAVDECLSGVTVERESLAGLFRGSDQTYVVYRLTLRGEDVYFMGGDCPPGFYRLAQWPPQVALRLHLGKLIRAERAES